MDDSDDVLNWNISDNSCSSEQPISDNIIPTPKRVKISCDTEENSQQNIQIQNDEKIAIELQQRFEEELSKESNEEESLPLVQDKCEKKRDEFTDQSFSIWKR